MATRIEKDSMGEMVVPADAYYGAQTARALHNFPISGLKPHQAFVWATVTIKKCAAQANMFTGRLLADIGAAIVAAADEVLAGGLADQFVVDPFQAGANSGAADSQLQQCGDAGLKPFTVYTDGGGVRTELLSHPDRHRILEMSASRLEDMIKLL